MNGVVFRPNTAGTISVAYTGTAGVSAALPAGVYRIWASTDAYVDVGASASAVATDMPITAETAEYIRIRPSYKISAIQQASGGTLFITPISL